MLRHDTIRQLREGAGTRFFGKYLQSHLDRYPLVESPRKPKPLSPKLQAFKETYDEIYSEIYGDVS